MQHLHAEAHSVGENSQPNCPMPRCRCTGTYLGPVAPPDFDLWKVTDKLIFQNNGAEDWWRTIFEQAATQTRMVCTARLHYHLMVALSMRCTFRTTAAILMHTDENGNPPWPRRSQYHRRHVLTRRHVWREILDLVSGYCSKYMFACSLGHCPFVDEQQEQNKLWNNTRRHQKSLLLRKRPP